MPKPHSHRAGFLSARLASSLMALCLGISTTSQAQTVFNLDFDHAYFLPDDMAGKGFSTGETTEVTSGGSGTVSNRMALWDEGDVNWWERQVGTGDYNSVVSDIDWNTTAGNPNSIDGNLTGNLTPNYRGIVVKDFWKGLGLQIISDNSLSLLDSHDYTLNDGVAGDNVNNNIRDGAGGSGGDGDTDVLTGNGPNVVAKKANKTAPNNTAPTL